MFSLSSPNHLPIMLYSLYYEDSFIFNESIEHISCAVTFSIAYFRLRQKVQYSWDHVLSEKRREKCVLLVETKFKNSLVSHFKWWFLISTLDDDLIIRTTDQTLNVEENASKSPFHPRHSARTQQRVSTAAHQLSRAARRADYTWPFMGTPGIWDTRTLFLPRTVFELREKTSSSFTRRSK